MTKEEAEKIIMNDKRATENSIRENGYFSEEAKKILFKDDDKYDPTNLEGRST